MARHQYPSHADTHNLRHAWLHCTRAGQRTSSQAYSGSRRLQFGAILFDLFTGRPPFLGEHALAVIQQTSEKPAPKLRSLAPALDRDLETICAGCLEREPQARYLSASDLAVDLERWLERLPIITRRVSPPVRAWHWSKRNPKFAAATTAAFCSAMALAFLLFSHNGLPPQSRLDPRLSTTSSIPRKEHRCAAL